MPLAQATGSASWVLFGIAGVVAGVATGLVVYLLRRKAFQQKHDEIVERGKQEAAQIVRDAGVEAKEQLLQIRSEFEQETQETRQELRQLQRQLAKREDSLEQKNDILIKKEKYVENLEKDLAERLRNVAAREKELEELVKRETDTLFKISGMSREEAVKLLLERLESEVGREADQIIRRSIERINDEVETKAREVVVAAIQRCAVEHTTESVVSTIDLASDDMKGRIIGREGRNIRAFEKATGIDVIVDDTPGVVVVSGFDGVRREIARRAMEKLIQDGRIHPARIEELVQKCQKEVQDVIRQTGKQACVDLDIAGLKPQIVECLGRLKYRTSYSQNQWMHSVEVGFLCGVMAAELGLNVKQARRAGLLHDIGKAVDHEIEGSHAVIGADLAKRYGESPKIIHAIKAHHEDEKPDSILAVLVQASDALSGARPGARHEMLESYIKRLEDLEKICASYQGVEKSYAMQAGREVRVIVENSKVSDEEVSILSKEIAKKIENELTYPGQIKVTVIRETRAVEFAK